MDEPIQGCEVRPAQEQKHTANFHHAYKHINLFLCLFTFLRAYLFACALIVLLIDL